MMGERITPTGAGTPMNGIEANLTPSEPAWAIYSHLDTWTATSTVVFPLLLSLASALVFWLAFSYIPERARRNKLRPVVDHALADAYSLLFSMFDLILGHSKHQPSFYQPDIRSGHLPEEAILLGLRNKCLNESYKYDPVIRDSLLVIGHDLLDKSLALDALASKILGFHTYATAQEILLLEQIRTKIREYDFNAKRVGASCETLIGGLSYRPIDPSLAYRHRNFCELYGLFCTLQCVVARTTPKTRDQLIFVLQALYYSGQYKSVRRLVWSAGKWLNGDMTLCNIYLALSERGLGHVQRFYSMIAMIYRSRPYGGSLVASRSLLKDIMDDNELVTILSQSHSAEEVEALMLAVHHERHAKLAFEHANRQLGEYYTQCASLARSNSHSISGTPLT